MKIMQLIWQIYGSFFIKLSTHQPRDPAAPLFGIYAREMKICVHTKLCTGMIKATIFTISQPDVHQQENG